VNVRNLTAVFKILDSETKAVVKIDTKFVKF